jgi:hypothetical protein
LIALGNGIGNTKKQGSRKLKAGSDKGRKPGSEKLKAEGEKGRREEDQG